MWWILTKMSSFILTPCVQCGENSWCSCTRDPGRSIINALTSKCSIERSSSRASRNANDKAPTKILDRVRKDCNMSTTARSRFLDFFYIPQMPLYSVSVWYSKEKSLNCKGLYSGLALKERGWDRRAVSYHATFLLWRVTCNDQGNSKDAYAAQCSAKIALCRCIGPQTKEFIAFLRILWIAL